MCVEFLENYLLHIYLMVKLPWTLKQHIILEHLGEYFSLHRVTLRATSGKYIESVHSSSRRLEEIHNLHLETKIGTKAHMNRLLWSSCLLNLKNEGFKMMKLGVPENEFWSEDNLHWSLIAFFKLLEWNYWYWKVFVMSCTYSTGISCFIWNSICICLLFRPSWPEIEQTNASRSRFSQFSQQST